MSKPPGEAIGTAGESSPSIGLAVVDSMTDRQIKAFASHARGFCRGATARQKTCYPGTGLAYREFR